MPSPARDERDAWNQAGTKGDPWGLYRHDATKERRRATRAEIAALDEVQGWRPLVSLTQWRVAWAWALGIKEKRVIRKLKVSRVTLWRWRKSAMETIAAALNRSRT